MSPVARHDHGSFWRVTLCSLVGPLVWALHLALVYGGQHLLCALGVFDILVYWFVVGISILAVGALLPFVVTPARLFRRFGGDHWPETTALFLVGSMHLLVILSLAGIVWAGGAVLVLPECSIPA